MTKLIIKNPLSFTMSNKIRSHLKFKAKEIAKLWFISQPKEAQNYYLLSRVNSASAGFSLIVWNGLAAGKPVVPDQKKRPSLDVGIQAEIIEMVEKIFKDFKQQVLIDVTTNI